MKQIEFIWALNRGAVQTILQSETESDGVIGKIRPTIELAHYFTRNDLTTIHFLEGDDTYEIETKDQLQEICTIHMTNESAESLIREYCEKNLKKV